MMRRKNLERAVILGLLLSTSVYGSAWAEAPNVEIIKTDEFVQSEAVTNPWNGNTEIKDGYDLVVNTDKVGVGIGYNGIVNVVDGDLTVNSSSNSIQSGYSENAEVKILANNVTLNAGTNGIFTTTESGYASTVILGSEDRNITGLTINAGGQGIDNKNGNVYIYGSDNSIIYIASNKTSGKMENQAAINNAVKDGIVTVNGGSITLSAVGGNGITNGEKLILGSLASGVESTTTLNSNKVTINASVNGIYNNKGTTTLNTNGTNLITADENAVYNHGSGTITIRATAGTGDEGISTLANYDDYNNELVGGENGVQSDSTGTTNVIADNDNVIAGTKNGILSDGAGTITVNAGNNNIIGQYTDDAGTHTSNTGIRVSEGTVNITAKNENRIYGLGNGIIVTDKDTNKTVNVIGDVNSITIENATNDAAGINFNNVSNGSVNINNGLDNNGNTIYADEFNVKVSSTGEAMGLKFDSASGNEVNVYANDISIKTDSGERGTAIWIQSTTEDNTINLNANDNVYLSSSAKANASGAVVWFTGKENTIKINGGSNTITSVDSPKRIEGIHLAGSGNDISINANSGDNQIYSQSVAVNLSDSSGTFKLDAVGSNAITSTNNNGLSIFNISEVNITAGQDNKIDAESNGIAFTTSTSSGTVTLKAANNIIEAGTEGISLTEGTTGTVQLTATSGNNEITADNRNGIAVHSSSVTLTADQGKNIIKAKDTIYNMDSAIYVMNSNSNVTLNAAQNEIESGKYGIYNGDSRINGELGGTVNVTATGDNLIKANKYGIRSVNFGEVTVSANNSNLINGIESAIETRKTGNVNVTANSGNNELISVDSGDGYTLYAASGSTISTTAKQNNNKVVADLVGIYAEDTGSTVTLDARKENVITADTENSSTENGGYIANYGYGNSYAIYSETGATINLKATNINKVSGAVYANGLDDEGNVLPTSVTLDAAENNVYSAAVIDGAGDIDTSEGSGNKFAGKQFVSSLYAEDGAHIELTGENHIGTWADNEDENTLERTVWAYSQDDDIASSIKITGAAQIGTDRYAISPNSADIAIAAGTATNLDKNKVDNFDKNDGKRSTVTVEYDNFADGSISSISGDILSAYAGQVDIYSNNDEARINVNGNLLAGNNGILNIDLGKGGYFEGRTDDYQDAGTVANEDHLEFYDPAFSSTIYSDGEVNLDMGTGSYWKVTGQSWVTSLKGEGSTIDMRNSGDENTTSHAVHIGTLTGNNTFVMDLNDTSHDISDMLYIKDEEHSSGEQKVFLNSVAGFEDMKDGDKLRFATVNAGADKLTFVGEYNGENGYTGGRSRAMLYNVGFNDIAFEIKNETYSEEDTENVGYNGEKFDDTKPGDDYVDAEYGNGATNWYLTRNSSGDETSDAGKTMLNMSRANYSNAIYMDRLNKRLGEARYINDDPEEDEGMWVRIRHDRIGKEDAFRSQNTMYELGYDKRQECDNGKRRVGFAVDYMHGDTGYSDIAGKGEIDRYGLWLYDTWTGNKGHYADYVAKWGHLQNDFEVYTMTGGEKVTGDYSNNVFSISAEYGRKKDMGNDWYIEPQAQLQLARVTGADYTTSQGTKVSVDGINSLIGRAGFRIGKDFGEEKQSTVYFKADVLHEFLGDQDISAMDKTTNGNWSTISYENEGTWYDIGIGYAAMMSKSSYAFIDLEQSFGNDNDDTYQINAGVRWTF